jgi:hypothetical protein
MVAEQRQMLTKVQKQRDIYREINRVILRENLDLRDTLEENDMLDAVNLQNLKDLFSPLAELENEKQQASDDVEEDDVDE